MPDLTSKLGIKKPLGNENVTRAGWNENWDIIDAGVQKEIKKQNTAPTTPAQHDLWVDTTATPNILKRYDGSQWVNVGITGGFLPLTGGTLTGDLTVTKVKATAATNLNIVPASGTFAGFRNSGDSSFLLYVNDTNGAAYAKNNVLDDGNGSATFKNVTEITQVSGSSQLKLTRTGTSAGSVYLGVAGNQFRFYDSTLTNYYHAVDTVTGVVTTKNNTLDDGSSAGVALFGGATTGRIRLVSDSSTGAYVQAVNPAGTGSASLTLSGLNGVATTVKTVLNTLDNGVGNASVAGTLTVSGLTNAVGGFQVEVRNGTDPSSPAVGRMWLRSDL